MEKDTRLSLELIGLVNLRRPVVPRQLEMNAAGGAGFGTDPTFLAKHLQVRRLPVDQTHDLRRAPLDTDTAAITSERVDDGKHILILLKSF
jgi:hypothetical protein